MTEKFENQVVEKKRDYFEALAQFNASVDLFITSQNKSKKIEHVNISTDYDFLFTYRIVKQSSFFRFDNLVEQLSWINLKMNPELKNYDKVKANIDIYTFTSLLNEKIDIQTNIFIKMIIFDYCFRNFKMVLDYPDLKDWLISLAKETGDVYEKLSNDDKPVLISGNPFGIWLASLLE